MMLQIRQEKERENELKQNEAWKCRERGIRLNVKVEN